MKGYVQVYRNLNKKASSQLGNGIDPKVVGDQPVYSVRGDDGLIKKHLCHFVIHDCTFRVQEGGKRRVRDEKRKNVHAYIQGREAYNEEEQRWEYIGPACTYVLDPNTVTVSYNPYENDSFVRKDTGEALTTAKVVIFGCGELGREVKAIL